MAEATYQDVSQVLSDIVNRIRSLEGKYNILAERLLIVNQNMITQFKKSNVEFKAINSDMKDNQKQIFNSKETVADLAKEMHFFATKEEIKVLEKYINLWDPMKFVSQKELENELSKLKYKGKNAGRKRKK